MTPTYTKSQITAVHRPGFTLNLWTFASTCTVARSLFRRVSWMDKLFLTEIKVFFIQFADTVTRTGYSDDMCISQPGFVSMLRFWLWLTPTYIL